MTTDIDEMADEAIEILEGLKRVMGLKLQAPGVKMAEIDKVIGHIREIDCERRTAWEESMGEDL